MREVTMEEYLAGKSFDDHPDGKAEMVKVKSGRIKGSPGPSAGIGITLGQSREPDGDKAGQGAGQ